MSELFKIQQALKVPKNQRNKFGNYNYRSCEDILEALKKPLAENECYLSINDSVELIGDRFYIKATVSLKKDGKVLDQATAYAREAEQKKGMDDSQVTGATSSYARKYALNGLFAIDDTKDADINEYTNTRTQAASIDDSLAQIQKAKDLDQLVKAWKLIAPKFIGRSELKTLTEEKDKRKAELQNDTRH